jgi:hypothetical protein
MNALATNISKSANNVSKNVSAPMNSSLVQLGNIGNSVVNGVNSLNSNIQDGINSFGNGIKNTVNNTAKMFNFPSNVGEPIAKANNAINNAIKNVNKNLNSVVNLNMGSTNNTAAAVPGWAWFAGIFLVLIGVFVGLFFYFAEDIKTGYNHLFTSVRGALGLDKEPVPEPPATDPTTEPIPQMPEIGGGDSESILEKVLPIGRSPEVFNVSKNDFTYYDAEPLCKALGAELATYEQVKEAYERGADWCNYGWTKGQVALYPTQKATWEDLQKGSEDERGACGRPGLNGGYFDNPEMRFGVNCYGPKPSQSAHDEAELMKEGRIPRTTASLKIDQKMREFEAQADTFGILPFNKGKWGTA